MALRDKRNANHDPCESVRVLESEKLISRVMWHKFKGVLAHSGA
jgi:hypothetical protein